MGYCMSVTELIVRNRGGIMPALITNAGDQAAPRFLEFFTVNIHNRNTRAAYARAAGNAVRSQIS